MASKNKYAKLKVLSSSFHEVQTIWRDLQVQWAGAFGEATKAVAKALNTPSPNSARGELDLKQSIKWKFLISQLLLRKPPSDTGRKALTPKPIIQRRLDQYDAGVGGESLWITVPM